MGDGGTENLVHWWGGIPLHVQRSTMYDAPRDGKVYAMQHNKLVGHGQKDLCVFNVDIIGGTMGSLERGGQ